MDRVDCILTLMELFKDMFVKAVLQSAEKCDKANKDEPNGNEQVAEVVRQGLCLFDPCCPLDSCPFKLLEPQTAFVARLINGGDQGEDAPTAFGEASVSNQILEDIGKSDKSDKIQKLDEVNKIDKDEKVEEIENIEKVENAEEYESVESVEIEDDADLFILRVGRVDPCPVRVPVCLQDKSTQYLVTDLPSELFPPRKVVPAKPKKKSKKTKKNSSKKKRR